MAQMKLEDEVTNSLASDDNWSKPLPEEPSNNNDSAARPKLRDWKTNAGKSNVFSGPLPPAPVTPPSEEKPALPPRRESINKSLEVEVAEKPRMELSKALPPKPPAPGVIMPLVPPKVGPFKPDKPPEPKKEDKNKALHLRNEMGLECGHKVSAKEVKKFNLKPVPKPPKPKAESPEEKPEASPSPAAFVKPKPVLRPKPIPTAKPDAPQENKVDISNLRSKLRPPKPMEAGAGSEGAQLDGLVNNGSPAKEENGHGQDAAEAVKVVASSQKEPPQRPLVAPRRPPPPKKAASPSSPTEPKFPVKDFTEPKPVTPQNRPPPPKPKASGPLAPKDKDKDESKLKVAPKQFNKIEKPEPPKEKLPPLIKDASKEELFIAVADFEGDEQTPGFKEGTLFEVLEKNASGWWFCKNISGGLMKEGWIPSNYLAKKP